MLFNSLVFLYRFLPLCLLVYFLVPRRMKNGVLLIASFVFYAWGGIWFTGILAGSVVLNYVMGLAIGQAPDERGRKRALIQGVVLNIALLAIFKYTGFAVRNISVLTGLLGLRPWIVDQVVLPLGISFYTFKALSYLFSVKRGETPPQRNIIDLALYLALFPQLIAGPIDRYRALGGQIRERRVTIALFASGVERLALGLFKKVIISAPIALVADRVFTARPEMLSTPLAWFGAACYTLQVYFDFSGYTDMAIGLGRMFGFTFTENFNFPYIARSLRDFWRRWHITLSTWLRDYLFLPIAYSLSRKLKKERYLGVRVDHHIYIVATLVTFVLCGFWHGPAWHFVAWGALHGLALSLERTPFGKWLDRGFRPLAHMYVLLFLVVSMVFFRADTLTSAVKFLAVMSGLRGAAPDWPGFQEYFTREFVIMAAIAVLGSTPFFSVLRDRILRFIHTPGSRAAVVAGRWWSAGSVAAVVALLLISTMYLLSQTNTPFIYFKF